MARLNWAAMLGLAASCASDPTPINNHADAAVTAADASPDAAVDASPDAAVAIACDPLADNDFLGSDVGGKTGTACGSSLAVGCYGAFAHTSQPGPEFICSLPFGGYTGSNATGNLVEGSSIPAGARFFNSCAPGYIMATTDDTQGSMQADCLAFCSPSNSFGPLGGANVGTVASGPNGGVSHHCNTTDARGTFGTAAAPDGTNGEHCVFGWTFQIEPSENVHLTQYSDTVGVCIDHTKYQYDSNNDGMITAADATWPACPTVPLASTGGDDPLFAGNFGCVDHLHGRSDGTAWGTAPSAVSRVLIQRPHFIAPR